MLSNLRYTSISNKEYINKQDINKQDIDKVLLTFYKQYLFHIYCLFHL